MKRFLRFAIIAAMTAAALGACRVEPAVPGGNGGGGVSEEASPEIKWIYDELCDEYYWNAAVKAASPDVDLEYDVFLERLLVGLGTAARDSDGTMDGGVYGGERYIYSYITRTESSGTRADFQIDNNTQTTFGLGAYPFATPGSPTLIQYLVVWIQPGGPAAEKGIERGMWITKCDGQYITRNNYEDVWDLIYYPEGGDRIRLTSGSSDYTLDAVTMDVDPILCDDVITTDGGKKVGYLAYNEFHPGANDLYDNQMRQIFGEFNGAGVTEIVIDLRYNPGGYVSSCRTLTGLISNAGSGKTFCKYKYKSDNSTLIPENFRNEANALKNLNPEKKVYVLATESSASASEMVINSLRGIDFEVVHIGEPTEGKNVGMTLSETTIEGYDYEMWPITFRIYNAKNESDYHEGFTPTIGKDEFREWRQNTRTGVIYPLGDRRERLLAAALTMIDGGTVTNDPLTRAESGGDVLKTPRTTRGGARLTPAEAAELKDNPNAEE